MVTFLKIFIVVVLALASSVGSPTDAPPPISLMSRPDSRFYQVTSNTKVQTEMSVSIFLS